MWFSNQNWLDTMGLELPRKISNWQRNMGCAITIGDVKSQESKIRLTRRSDTLVVAEICRREMLEEKVFPEIVRDFEDRQTDPMYRTNLIALFADGASRENRPVLMITCEDTTRFNLASLKAVGVPVVLKLWDGWIRRLMRDQKKKKVKPKQKITRSKKRRQRLT